MDPQESKIFFSILIASFVLGVIMVYFIINMIKHHKHLVKLQLQKASAEIIALEKDRSRIAADVHDDLSPLLSAAKMRINSFELPAEDDLEQLNKTNEALDEVLKRMREIAFDLMPEALLRKGLVPAISQFINNVSLSNKLQIDFTSPDHIMLNEQKTINIYRIVKEIIHNTIKHANATCMVLDINIEKGYLIFSATDNGDGFNVQNVTADSTGFGLRSIVNRTELIGGET